MGVGATVLALVLVTLGGGLGAVVRWAVREAGQRQAMRRVADPGAAQRITPWLTFLTNLLACFLLGLVVAQFGSAASTPGRVAYLALGAGFCGGMSTLSTAAFDVIDLLRRGTAAMSLALLLLSAGGGMGALWVGLVIGS